MLNISLKTALRELKEEAISDISSKEPPTRDLSFKVSTCDNNKSLIHSKELSYLNSNWHNWMIANDISSHRPLIGKVISRVKRFVIDVVWTYLFKDYVEREKKFQENLVRYLNDNINYIDKKNYEIFWQIINKLDKDISKIPLVLQYNKRDLGKEGIPLLSVTQMEADMNAKLRVPAFTASAVTGDNVAATMKKIISLTVMSLKKQLDLGG